MGGENIPQKFRPSREQGSSPRGRGKRFEAKGERARWRLIPAWAGKTNGDSTSAASSPAHPRVGGENREAFERYNVVGGSSPRGRGKPGLEDLCGRHLRLIPAWAGKTFCPGRSASSRGAHPRVGGENPANSPRAILISGSSPRGRGKLDHAGAAGGRHGLIPAWAGKTSSS